MEAKIVKGEAWLNGVEVKDSYSVTVSNGKIIK